MRLQTREQSIKTVCAYCKRHISGSHNASLVSHGICQTCAVEVRKEIQRMRDLRLQAIQLH